MTVVLSKEDVSAYLDEVFPQVRGDFAIDDLVENRITVRLLTAGRHLRPGVTVSGPSLFALADVAAYAMIMGMVGPKALAVTTNCSIDFMRKPVSGKNVVAQGTVLKLGKSLAISEVHMFSEGSDQMVARASLTYALPPDRVHL